MWPVIIIVIIGLFIYFNNQNKEVQNANLSQGGYRKSFPILTNHLENYYEMSFFGDDGTKFSYQKSIKDVNGDLGNLIIGVKLDMTGKPLLFSEFNSLYKGHFSGIPVASINFNDIKTIDECINISLNKIKEQGIIDYSNSKNKIIPHNMNSEFIKEWTDFNNEFTGTELSVTINSFVNNFFVPDCINFEKFVENFDVLQKSWKSSQANYGTPSIKKILYLPPAFNKSRLCSYRGEEWKTL